VLQHTLISLSNQSLKADNVILCISKEKYLIDQGIGELPDWLNTLVDAGEVTIKWVENTGPYRKLLPAYNMYSNQDWIVTCDDDVIYGQDWLSSMVMTAKAHPNAIICGRARIPVKSPIGGMQSYLNWPLAPLGAEGLNLLPTGVSGVLYRKPLLDERIMLSEDYKVLAPKQDDLWFNLARQVAKTKVVVSAEAGKHVFPIETPNTLSATNASTMLPGWDRFIHALFGRISQKMRGYLGFSACDNDIALRRLAEYKLSTTRKLGL
jgi:hypothetical protein